MEKRTKTNNNLIIARRQLAFHKDEKGKRADELILANIELAYQNKEKEKRAEELIVANKELAFQNKEKGKRARELVLANKELVFQNKEKEKRADELCVANEELAFQNEEKGKRADELMIANRELKKAEAGIRKINRELKTQYKKLLQIAFMQSHQVRVPVANILGLYNLFNFDDPGDPVNGKVLEMLKLVAESLDNTIHQITQNTIDIRKLIKE